MTIVSETHLTDLGSTTPPFTGRSRWLAASVFAIGAALQLAESLLEPESSNTAHRLAWWANHPQRMDWSQAMGILAVVFLLLGIAVMWLLTRRDTPRVATTAAVLMSTAMIGLGVVHGIELAARWAMIGGHADAAQVILTASSPRLPGVVGFVLFLPAAALGNLVMAAALWRSRSVPRATALLLVAFVLLDFVVDIGVVSHAALLSAGLVVGWAIITGYRRNGSAKPAPAAH